MNTYAFTLIWNEGAAEELEVRFPRTGVLQDVHTDSQAHDAAQKAMDACDADDYRVSIYFG